MAVFPHHTRTNECCTTNGPSHRAKKDIKTRYALTKKFSASRIELPDSSGGPRARKKSHV
jgi:hypothetical protein